MHLLTLTQKNNTSVTVLIFVSLSSNYKFAAVVNVCSDPLNNINIYNFILWRVNVEIN